MSFTGVYWARIGSSYNRKLTDQNNKLKIKTLAIAHRVFFK